MLSYHFLKTCLSGFKNKHRIEKCLRVAVIKTKPRGVFFSESELKIYNVSKK